MIVNFFSRLARLPRVLLLLVLSRPERRVQHHELPEPGDGRLIDARARPPPTATWRRTTKNVKGFVDKAFDEVPRVPLFQPYLNVAMQKNISGYRYWFHRQLDYRTLVKG